MKISHRLLFRVLPSQRSSLETWIETKFIVEQKPKQPLMSDERWSLENKWTCDMFVSALTPINYVNIHCWLPKLKLTKHLKIDHFPFKIETIWKFEKRWSFFTPKSGQTLEKNWKNKSIHQSNNWTDSKNVYLVGIRRWCDLDLASKKKPNSWKSERNRFK